MDFQRKGHIAYRLMRYAARNGAWQGGGHFDREVLGIAKRLEIPPTDALYIGKVLFEGSSYDEKNVDFSTVLLYEYSIRWFKYWFFHQKKMKLSALQRRV